MPTLPLKLLLAVVFMLAPACAHSHDAGSPYVDLRKVPEGTIIHLRTGMEVDRATLFDHLARAQVVYVGETHDNPDAHRVQAEVLHALADRHPDLAVGLEMVPRDHQPLLDDWIAGRLGEKEFARRWTHLWHLGYAAYREILVFARDRRIPLIALNAPRALVKAVSREGLDGLSDELRAQLPADMDLSDPYHREKTAAIFGGHGKEHVVDLDRFYPAQVIWDETMAETGADYLARHPGSHLLILTGDYHIEHGIGIPRRLFRRLPVPFFTVYPYTPVTPEDKQDRLMDVKIPDTPILLADFAWAVPYGDLPGVRLGVGIDTSDGLHVKSVEEGSPAARGGVQPDDRLEAINGNAVHDLFDLHWALSRLHSGDTATVTVRRGETVIESEVTF